MGTLEETLELYHGFKDDCIEADAVLIEQVRDFVHSLDEQQVRDVSSLFNLCGWAVYPPAALTTPLISSILQAIQKAIYDAFWDYDEYDDEYDEEYDDYNEYYEDEEDY